MEEDEAARRRRMGENTLRRVPRTVAEHPSVGGSSGYPVSQRIENIALAAEGLPHTASNASIARWENRLYPYRCTGNKEDHKLRGTRATVFNWQCVVENTILYTTE